MKCMYYLAPTLVSTHQVSNDLREVGIDYWHIHVVSKDEAGLKSESIHSSNWLETKDLVRDGFIGAVYGFIAGIVVAAIMMMAQPFGPGVPGIVHVFPVIVATLIGAWIGGLTGIDSENKKLRRFHGDIEAGQYLVLIYVRKGQGDKVKSMMNERHPEARHVATDRNLINPFGQIERRQSGQA